MPDTVQSYRSVTSKEVVAIEPQCSGVRLHHFNANNSGMLFDMVVAEQLLCCSMVWGEEDNPAFHMVQSRLFLLKMFMFTV